MCYATHRSIDAMLDLPNSTISNLTRSTKSMCASGRAGLHAAQSFAENRAGSEVLDRSSRWRPR